MGRRCCIAGCNSTSRLPEHHGVTYHSFPLDAATRAVWIRNTRLNTDRQITKSVLVCSRHFRRVDFQPQRSGKYLLKQRVFPTVFPWGKVDLAQVEADVEALKSSGLIATTAANAGKAPSVSTEDATKATVEATVAQIMAQTAELNAAAGIKSSIGNECEGGDTSITTGSSPNVKFEAVTSFNPGARLEAQDFDGAWHAARVVEVDNDDREVLIKFERSGKNKSNVAGTEEWIPMNSTRLRQKVSTKPIPVFALEEKCMARWSGSRKFPGMVKKILGNDMYEVLFDDGYVKNVRALHMSKITSGRGANASPSVADTTGTVVSASMVQSSAASPTSQHLVKLDLPSTSSSAKKRASAGLRKDWPLLDMSKLDLAALNLPEIPHDGEWTCHWVNDQPIGREGFLIVGEHRKPTVIVEDWRLPPGWIKHMYQRSNVLGKWDVILVTPNNKRFRSKADLKVFLEEQGQVYNPDIYDFSIHRRRAKDINAYVYTPDYTPQQTPKPKQLDTSLDIPVDANVTLDTSTSRFLETPVAPLAPPMELMTSPLTTKPTEDATETPETPVTSAKPETQLPATTAITADATLTALSESGPPVEDGYAYIGGLKVQIVDNLFRCPQEGCSKNFRKENHLQIHVKHYHHDLSKLLGACPKMQELAEKRTHTIKPDQNEPTPKNQMSNQEFFTKLHLQDQQLTRAHRKNVSVSGATPEPDIKPPSETATEQTDANVSAVAANDLSQTSTAAGTSIIDQSLSFSTADDSTAESPAISSGIPSKRSRFSPSKRQSGSRKSNRQRTTRRYLTAAQATAGTPLAPVITADSSFGVSDFEETRHSFNATPDAKTVDVKKRKASAAPATPMSSIDSPITADSGSSLFQPLHAPSSNEVDGIQPQYIKENGEIIKIVRMRQEEIINCLCSYGEEDGLMIQCELCLCWQHGICNGIDKESDVPDKYICYICRNPQRGRESMRFKHDQDWLYEGKLPVANYHIVNPMLPKRFEYLKKSHTLTGNLVELKRFMHSLRVKINIANNRCHPKLYLWAKKWDEDVTAVPQQLASDMENYQYVKKETDDEGKSIDPKDRDNSVTSSPTKRIKVEPTTPLKPLPNIPQPEAPIDPVECQHRLLEHIKVQQSLVMNRLGGIEAQIDELERHDDLPDLNDADLSTTKDILAAFIKDLDIMKQIAKLNVLENTKQTLAQNAITPK